jgi:ketosteroid isomerase-like protein
MKYSRLSLLMLTAVICLAAARALADDTRTQASVRLQANSGASQDQDSVRQIQELERQAKDASVHRDAAFAERMLADDYVAITPLGQVITKGDTIAARRSGQLRYDSIDISDMVVRVYGNTAVVTARAEVKGKDLGEEFSVPYRYTRVWIRRSGHWQTVSYQATVTK